MNKTDWKGTAELIGIAAIVASLIFVGMQLRQEQAIAIVDTYGSIVESNEAVLGQLSRFPKALFMAAGLLAALAARVFIAMPVRR